MAAHLTITSARIPSSDAPICGVTLEPYVLIRRPDGQSCNAEECPEEGSGDARFSLRFRWYRSVVNKGGHVCFIHQDREATLQCILCLRAKVELRKSFTCSTDCLRQHWNVHKNLHLNGQQHKHENGYVHENFKASNTFSNGGETWMEVGKGRLYTPTEDDVGSVLKCEVVAIDTGSPYTESGKTHSIATSRVRPAPSPPRRSLSAINPAPKNIVSAGKFTALTYNLLADLYATAEQFSYCQPWMLAWGYRKQNLLKELLNYNADIMCLQEVQSNHYTEFLQPELAKAGYTAIYKKKTMEIYTGNSYAIDGCATFFKTDRFALVKKYEVEFNKAALSLAESIPLDQRKGALNRLLKDNVALIVVLEALDPPNPDAAAQGRRQLICIANTHIHANPELNDVKLWQVNTLLKGLEKIAASADIPMLVAGDFNSVPGSAAHTLLLKRGVDPNHPELANDPLNIFKAPSKLQHRLVLSSAYAAGHEAAADADPRHRRRNDHKHHEPKFTNVSKDFKGTLDYIFFTSESLVPVSLLDLPDDSLVQKAKGSGLPNEHWSSDHIALMSEFQYKQEAA
ncbi:hypothetical protein COCSUDRAFT_54570 [Coccomyxa subellipsoidea C-169]|uniref:Endonuclease/exonuclease/phosphatase domain-containing protein n=1 Tax=Coccomyxa subellipsoidea (strain C-169) TaxID=574566 RepID=I0YMM2_COCSC|nr:hypothetical protein COCSUDRAFT_54570 [Coccomyxa subellipsoidea C-169]EIE19641.1 hypothetical protein COCSUDRAFT_54570 [Coccomyxa subellipsoidea C-169]|eukprot:XP_005644185.1 hypothetical protein COCSUDRAFT_54570 [Coccomyxa subellipsoidea C-169]